MRVHISAKHFYLTSKNLGGHVTLAAPPFGKIFGGHVRTVLGTLVSNFKSVALTVFELLAFNDQKFRGSRDPATPNFGKIFWGHVRTVPGNKFVKFQVRSFNRFELLAFNSH